jgi:hypothetical protein
LHSGTHVETVLDSVAKAFIRFTSAGRYFNLSRADIGLLYAGSPLREETYPLLSDSSGRHIICTSVGLCQASHLTTLIAAPTKSGSEQKYYKTIEVVFHTVDWERFVSGVCMVWGVSEMQAPLAGNALTFSTRSGTQTVINRASFNLFFRVSHQIVINVFIDYVNP